MGTSSAYKALAQQPAPPVANTGTESSPSQVQAAPVTAPGTSSVVLDLKALENVFNPKEFEAVSTFADALDENEKAAALRYFCKYKEVLVRKKRVAANRSWRQLLRLKSKFDAEKAKKAVDEELGPDENVLLPRCYREIKNLLVLQKSPIHAKALEEWSKKEALFTSRVERKKKKVASLKNEIYQLIGFFSVFQGVLLTAVAQSNLLHCNNWWSPIVLSLVASVVTIFGVVQKLMQIKDLQKTIHSEEQSLKEVLGRLNTLRFSGVDTFEFAEFENREKKEQLVVRFWIYFSLVIASLLLFAAGFPLSHWRILCDPGPDPYQAAPVPSSS